ncbi:MAG: VWA domain-containing protein [Bacteroidales bacterium]|nr:VWA domain-containing protein [Candidatus Colimorpha onthohippi]
MIKRSILFFVGLWLLASAGVATSVRAQEVKSASPRTHLLIILDCSKSMWDFWQSDAKIKVTQQVLLRFIDSVSGQRDIDIALRVFGHLNKGSYGTKLEVPFDADNIYKLQSKIKTLVPNGGCTAAMALTNSLGDFSHLESDRNLILIITDGMDDCDGDICNVARQVQLSGVIVQTFILGIGNPSDFRHSLDCAGKFTYLPSEEGYTEALFDVLNQADQSAQVVLDLHDKAGVQYETSFPVAFYDAQTNVVKYTTYYTCSTHGKVDTLTVDPLVEYDVTLFTKPEIHIKGCKFKPNQVNRLGVTVEQGDLRIRMEGRRANWSVPSYPVLIRRQGESTVLRQQSLGEVVSYQSGLYDIEVLSRPPQYFNGVEVQGDGTTDITMPMPGMLFLKKPKQITTGSLFAIREGRLVLVCDLNPNSVNEQLLLMPGLYQLLIKPVGAFGFGSVRTVRFEIASAQEKILNFDL